MIIADIMTPDVATIKPDDTLLDAIDILTRDRISGIPVVDRIGAPIGMLTEGDLLRRVELDTDDILSNADAPTAADYLHSHSRKVGDVMSRPPVTVPDTMPLAEALRLMLDHKIRRLLVVQDGVLVGIVTRADFVRTIGNALRQKSLLGNRDKRICDRIVRELATQSWYRDGVLVSVDDGIVTLAGRVADAQERDAVRVLCEGVEGVVGVRLGSTLEIGAKHAG